MVGIVIATHCRVASALAEAATVVLGSQDALATVDLAPEDDRERGWGKLRDAVTVADRGDGVLVMVDVLGGTPSNLALALLAEHQVEVLTGVNLPMVLRALQHRESTPLDALARDVLEYGRRNVSSAGVWLRPAGDAP